MTALQKYIKAALKSAQYQYDSETKTYLAVVEELPICWGQGNSFEEARDELESVIEGFILLSIQRGEAIPKIQEVKNPKFIRIVCPAAKIDQEFTCEDLPALLADLPELIQEEQTYHAKHEAVLRFRVGFAEQAKIKQKARQNGQNISEYLRERALA